MKTKIFTRLATMKPGRYPIDTSHPLIDEIIEYTEAYILMQYEQISLPDFGIEIATDERGDYAEIVCVDLRFPKSGSRFFHNDLLQYNLI